MTCFADDDTDADAGVSYWRRTFTDSEYGWQDEVLGSAGVNLYRNRWLTRLAVSGGVFRDDLFPEDDHTWGALAPSLRFTDDSACEYSLRGSAGLVSYDSRTTLDGDRQADHTWSAGAGFWRPLSRRLFWEGELYTRGRDSNEDEDGYTGGGLTLGLEYEPRPRHRAGTALDWSSRTYNNARTPDSGDRTDDEWTLDAWYRFRLRRSIDLTAAAAYTSTDSAVPELSYDSWTIKFGVVATFETPGR